MRVIALRDDTQWGLVENAEFISTDEFLKKAYVTLGWCKPYDDTKPLIGTPIAEYEEKPYPKDRGVFRNGNIYKSKDLTSEGKDFTSATWVDEEWELKVQGL